MTNHTTTTVIKAAPTIPPTTPPAIAPAFELLCEVEVDDEPPDALGVVLDCETFLVDEGTINDVPVTSGLSRQNEYLCVNRAQGYRSHLLCLAQQRCSRCQRSARVQLMIFFGKASLG